MEQDFYKDFTLLQEACKKRFKSFDISTTFEQEEEEISFSCAVHAYQDEGGECYTVIEKYGMDAIKHALSYLICNVEVLP